MLWREMFILHDSASVWHSGIGIMPLNPCFLPHRQLHFENGCSEETNFVGCELGVGQSFRMLLHVGLEDPAVISDTVFSYRDGNGFGKTKIESSNIGWEENDEHHFKDEDEQTKRKGEMNTKKYECVWRRQLV